MSERVNHKSKYGEKLPALVGAECKRCGFKDRRALVYRPVNREFAKKLNRGRNTNSRRAALARLVESGGGIVICYCRNCVAILDAIAAGVVTRPES